MKAPALPHDTEPRSRREPTAAPLLPQTPVITYAIIAVCAAIFILQFIAQFHFGPDAPKGLLGFPGLHTYTVLRMGSTHTGIMLEENEWWRLVSAALLHGGLIHIIFNMLALRNIGMFAEVTWGRNRYWATYALSGIFASLVSSFWGPLAHGHIIPSVGASGAILGLLGLILGGSWRYKTMLPQQSVRGLWHNALYILVLGLLIPFIDNAGHVGGFACGFLLGVCLSPVRYRPARSFNNAAWKIVALTLLALAVACIGMAAHRTVYPSPTTREAIGLPPTTSAAEPT